MKIVIYERGFSLFHADEYSVGDQTCTILEVTLPVWSIAKRQIGKTMSKLKRKRQIAALWKSIIPNNFISLVFMLEIQ